MKTAFSEILSSLRRDRGFSQRRAAADLGISQALLSHYENGAREPKLDFVVKACDYYFVPADYLLGRTSERRSGGSQLARALSDTIGKLEEHNAAAAELIANLKQATTSESKKTRQSRTDERNKEEKSKDERTKDERTKDERTKEDKTKEDIIKEEKK